MPSQNVEIAKKAYEAYGAGDVESALADFDDNIEWSIPGNSAISGNYRGKSEFMNLLGSWPRSHSPQRPNVSSATAMTWSSSPRSPPVENPGSKPMC